jgi:hypothetical protein
MLSSSQILPLKPTDPGDAIDFDLGVAGTYYGAWTTGLAGAIAIAAQINFNYVSGSGGIKAYLQGSLDQGNTAFDIARADFSDVSRTVLFNIIPQEEGPTEPTALGGAAEGILGAFLGDRVRLALVLAGAYSGTIAARVCAA